MTCTGLGGGERNLGCDPGFAISPVSWKYRGHKWEGEKYKQNMKSKQEIPLAVRNAVKAPSEFLSRTRDVRGIASIYPPRGRSTAPTSKGEHREAKEEGVDKQLKPRQTSSDNKNHQRYSEPPPSYRQQNVTLLNRLGVCIRPRNASNLRDHSGGIA